MKEIGRLADLAGLEVQPKVRFLKYARPEDDEHVKNVGVYPGTFLDRPARETNRVSKRTVFQPEVLTAFVLTGFTPQILRVTGTEVRALCDVPGDRIQSRWFSVRFNTADVSYDEVRELYNDVRRYFGATDANLLKWEEAEFLLLVDSMGGFLNATRHPSGKGCFGVGKKSRLQVCPAKQLAGRAKQVREPR